MNMIENHVEQIALSAAAIAELPFPRPKVFTNALLNCPDITNLIRDTEAHERALFTITKDDSNTRQTSSRKSHYFDGIRPGTSDYTGPRSTTAVGRILGGDLLERIRQAERNEGKDRKEVDVEALLKGAERLYGAYPIPGAIEKIKSLRHRHTQLAASVERYESIVANQTAELDRMSRAKDGHLSEADGAAGVVEEAQKPSFSMEDLRREEREVRELEEKKRALEERVGGMERDLGGILR